MALRLRQFPPRRVQREAVVLRHALQPVPPLGVGGGAHQFNAAAAKRLLRVGHDQLGHEVAALAEAVAIGAHAARAVEAEVRVGGRLEAQAAVGAGEAGGEHQVILILHRRHDRPLREPQRLLDGVGDAGAVARGDADAVGDDLDVVEALAVKLGRVAQFDDLAVHSRASPAAPEHVLEEVRELALLPPDDRREDRHLCPLGQRHDPGDDRILRLAADLPPAARTVRHADGRVEHAQVVVYLRDRGDGRTRVVRAGRLVYRDGRRQPLDLINIRPREVLQELPGVA